MRQNVLKQLEQNQWLTQGERLLVGLSGGIDSVVLLHALKRVSAQRGLVLTAAHLDHGIRPESNDDVVFVEALCHKWGIPLSLERCDVPTLARQKKVSLEMAAREARREFLLRVARQQGADFIVLAHHRDDQAETFLLRLLRGSGLSGLSGMRQRSREWLRPLLDVGRQQILDYAREWKLEWAEDLSNRDTRYLRNRIRHELLPQLREYNPRLEERLANLCRQQQAEEEFWQQEVEEALSGVVLSREDGLRLCRIGLLALHPALRVRLVREAIRLVRGDLQRLEEKHLGAIEALLEGEQGQASLDLPGLWLARRYGQLWIRRDCPEYESFSMTLPVPGSVALPDGRLLQAAFGNDSIGETDTVVEFSAEQLSFPLKVRTFVEGDRFSPSGVDGSKKIKDFFIDIKLEREQRRQVPLVVSGDQILWIAGVRRSAFATVKEKSDRVVRLELVRATIQG